ncbi:hypothetical protein BOW53_03725 [Solemya pervernicosa gill symbiont]|uniref:Uncharacterized protein n=1 Tax=Solemya pervernicosa gill symbiont TaxID=642797 RepID=A0A1T2L8R3_9GAMM|nr:hypothetical protein BOW53_03725 [Solemya pervernicosa gill symbiont]
MIIFLFRLIKLYSSVHNRFYQSHTTLAFQHGFFHLNNYVATGVPKISVQESAELDDSFRQIANKKLEEVPWRA